LYKENDISCIKVIDFGLSKKLSENELMNTPNGTPYYIAPEVLKGNYDSQCDTWSMGVVLYIMLCGKPPFGGKNNTDILKSVVKGDFNFEQPAFEKCSDKVKDLITKLLVVDPTKRLTATEAFQHPWIQEMKEIMDSKIEIGDEVALGLQEYMETVQFKKTTLTFLASKIPESQIEKLRDAFIKIDKNGDGTITKDELASGVSSLEKCAL
jgi:calcium-dependent protein kinase